jgi:hypothetical protein
MARWGSVIDYQLGGAYDLEPDPLQVTLACGAEARRPSLGPTAEDLTLLQGFGQPIRTTGMSPSGDPAGDPDMSDPVQP